MEVKKQVEIVLIVTVKHIGKMALEKRGMA
jgi:hypothetical protein